MNETAIVTRSIEVTWGGEQRMLPVLPMDPADKWNRLFVKEFADEQEQPDAALAVNGARTRLLKMMLAYDSSKVLGTREWIRANVTDDELADAFIEVYRRSFRLSRLPQELVRTLLSGQPQPARSRNGYSPTGDLIPMPSDNGSPTSS